MSLYKFAKNELDLIYSKESLKEKDGADKWMYDNILQLIKTFSKQEHSGLSASYCSEVFYKLSQFKPIGKLTNNPNEWMEIDTNMYQSRRSPSCFSTDIKYYYDLDEKYVSKWGRLFVKNHYGMKLIKLKEFKNED